MSVQAGIRRTISSRASLASLSATSSSSVCSSSSDKNSFRSLKSSSSNGLNLAVSSPGTRHTGETQKMISIAPTHQQAHAVPRCTNTDSRGHGWLSFAAMHLYKLVAQVVNSLYPEVSYMVELLKTMLITYRVDEFIIGHRFEAVSHHAYAASFRELVVRSMDFAALNLQWEGGRMPASPSTEFQPKARLIVNAENLDDDGNEQWGHFADFDCIEGRDVVFLASGTTLGTLKEEGEEDL